MRILLITSYPLMPQSRGEIQSTIHEQGLLLAEQSEMVAVLCRLSGEGLLGLRGRIVMRALGTKAVYDRRLGYGAYRAANIAEALEEVLQQESPDVVLVYAHDVQSIASAFANRRIPIVVYLQNSDLEQPGDIFEMLDCYHYVTDCAFTAERLWQSFGFGSTIVYPIVIPEHHRTQTSGEFVTVFDPAPQEGGDIGLGAAARCQEIPFMFAEYEPLEASSRTLLLDTLRRLPNARFAPISMLSREILARTRLLVAPGRQVQNFSRLVAEAQISAIPVIAPKSGGMTESVGPGGILLEPDASLDVWVDAIRRLWSDHAYSASLSAKALDHAQRPEINPEIQTSRLREVLRAAVVAGRGSAGGSGSRAGV